MTKAEKAKIAYQFLRDNLDPMFFLLIEKTCDIDSCHTYFADFYDNEMTDKEKEGMNL